MSRRVRTCSDCGRPWGQRDARFCGVCGAPLVDLPTTSRGGDRRPVLRVVQVLSAIGLVGAAVMVAGLDLERVARDDDPTVNLDDEVSTSPNPLSEQEVAELRAQSDPDRLRCEPRGCERWRYELSQGQDNGALVALPNGLLLYAGGTSTVVSYDADGEERGEITAPLLVAVDPVTGEERWHHDLLRQMMLEDADDGDGALDGALDGAVDDADDDADGGADEPLALPEGLEAHLSLTVAPDGALVSYGGIITSLRDDGHAVWATRLEGDLRNLHLMNAIYLGDVILVDGWNPATVSAGQFSIVLDAASGEVLSTVESHGLVELTTDRLILMGEDGVVRGVELLTGETVWEGPQVSEDGWVEGTGGIWLVVHTADGRVVLDVASGEEVTLSGEPAQGLTSIGEDRVVALVATGDGELSPEATGSESVDRLALFERDGTPVWEVEIEPARAELLMCCDDIDGTIHIQYEAETRVHDLETGELVDVVYRRRDENWSPWFGRSMLGRPMLGESGDVRVRWHHGRNDLEVRTADGDLITFRGGRGGWGLWPVSLEPLVVSDGRHVIGAEHPDR